MRSACRSSSAPALACRLCSGCKLSTAKPLLVSPQYGDLLLGGAGALGVYLALRNQLPRLLECIQSCSLGVFCRTALISHFRGGKLGGF